MYLSKDREQAPKSSKKMIIAATAGIACAGIACGAYMSQEDTITFEEMELAQHQDLGHEFYRDIGAKCDEHWIDASNTFLKAQDRFIPYAKFMYENKHLLYQFGGDTYHRAMGSFIDQIELLTDAQRTLENNYRYGSDKMRLVTKNIPKGKWRVWLKWSTKFALACGDEKLSEYEKSIKEIEEDIQRAEARSHGAMNTMGNTFSKSAEKAFSQWDCEKMYPVPKKESGPNILNLIVEAGQEGFKIFNQVKGMLPEGTMSKLGIPGLPKGLTENISKVTSTFNQGKAMFDKYKGMADQMGVTDIIKGQVASLSGGSEEFIDFEDDLEELKFLGGESGADYETRKKIWADARAKCNKGKQEFGQAIKKAESEIKTLANSKVASSTLNHLDDSVRQTALQYKADVYAYADSGAQDMMSSAEKAEFGNANNHFTSQLEEHAKTVAHNKGQGLVNKAMLLQLGQH
jgi:hypothetical protein